MQSPSSSSAISTWPSIVKAKSHLTATAATRQSDTTWVYRDVGTTDSLVTRADRLLEELHVHLEAPMRAVAHALNPSAIRFGAIAKEAMFYGADSAFAFQYRLFARDRYRPDFEWLLKHTGLSVRPMIEIATWIDDQVTLQINTLLAFEHHPVPGPPPEVLTRAFLISKDLLTRRFRAKAMHFLRLFSVCVNRSNLDFNDAFAYNVVNSRPLIDLGDAIYVSNPYKLFESIYESPYYWMLQDSSYRDPASEHRGEFLEVTIGRRLRTVFGSDSVFTNVIIRTSKAQIAAEADVLVSYGEFLLVIQAKSKRLTLDARAGNEEKIRDDFRAGIQTAYNQAATFIDLLVAGAECDLGAKGRRMFQGVNRVFPIVVLSDHFPSLTLLTNQLLERHHELAPVVVDLFFFDVLCHILITPVDVLYYLQQRSRFFDRIITDSEFNLLGYHLGHKLYVADEWAAMAINKDFAADLSEYIELKEAGLPTSIEFLPLERRVDVPIMTALISALKSDPPEVAWTAIELLDFSEEALLRIAENITAVQAEVKAGKPFKAFSVETHYAGLSYVAVNALDDQAVTMAEMVARKHKYKSHKDHWYVLLDHIHSGSLIDAILSISEKWVESGDKQKFFQNADTLLKETVVAFEREVRLEEAPPHEPRLH